MASGSANVYKLYKALPVSADQMLFYDDGVGAGGNPVWKLLGGAIGTGLWNLTFDNGVLAAGYGAAAIVGQPEMAQAGGQ